MRNDGYPELVGRIDAIVDQSPQLLSDAEKLRRIKALISDHRATLAVQRAEFERKLEELEDGYKEQDYANLAT